MKDDIIRAAINNDTVDNIKSAAESIGAFVIETNKSYVEFAESVVEEAGNLAVDTHRELVDLSEALVDGVERQTKDSYSSLKGQIASWFNSTSGAEPQQAIVLTAEEAFKNLPTTSACDMPPEVQSLIEVKMSEELFRQHFEELKEQGSLREVMDFLRSQPGADETAPAETPDSELNRNSPAVANRLPSLG